MSSRITEQIRGLTERHGGRWGVYAENFKTGEHLRFHSDRSFEAASTVKVFVLLALFDQITTGRLSSAHSILVRKEDLAGGSGLIQSLAPQRYTVHNLAMLMIIISDNIATNLLIRLVGRASINRYIKKLGLTKSRLQTSQVDFPVGYTIDSSHIGTTTPAEIAMVMKQLYQGKLFNQKTTDQVLRIFRHQWFHKLAYRLPTGTNVGYRHSPIAAVMSKTGSIVYENNRFKKTSSDVAVIRMNNDTAYVMSAYYEGPADLTAAYSEISTDYRVFSEIGRVVHHHFVR